MHFLQWIPMRPQPDPIMLNSALPADTPKRVKWPAVVPNSRRPFSLAVTPEHKHPKPCGIIYLVHCVFFFFYIFNLKKVTIIEQWRIWWTVHQKTSDLPPVRRPIISRSYQSCLSEDAVFLVPESLEPLHQFMLKSWAVCPLPYLPHQWFMAGDPFHMNKPHSFSMSCSRQCVWLTWKLFDMEYLLHRIQEDLLLSHHGIVM